MSLFFLSTLSMILLYFPKSVVFSSVINRIRNVKHLSMALPKRLPTNSELKTPELRQEESDRVQRLVKFLDDSPEPFNCVQSAIKILINAGFSPVQENSLWRDSNAIKTGGKYFYTKNRSSIVAFAVGCNYRFGNGFKVIGAHTDSPNLKLKPKSKRSANGYIQLSVECYGGGLWYTWFDRDLSMAGRVILRKQSDDSESFEHRLVNIKRPTLRVPSLCIHLKAPEERDAFKINKEDHLMPILCEEVNRTLSTTSANSCQESDQWLAEQPVELLKLLADEIGCDAKDIADFELSLYDTQGAAVSGAYNEFLCSSRIDNLASCFVALESLVDHTDSASFNEDEDISLIALFDHEEVGSGSNIGAGSPIMSEAVARISTSLETTGSGDPELLKTSIGKSFILSVDMAHAVHPNYANKHDKYHSPKMNAGVVIKTNVNQRYASNGITSFFVRELGRKAGVPIQEFSVRNDCPCGSTVGPILSQNTGIRAVDLGMPQLSMHSIREMMGISDLTFAHKLFTTFFRDFRRLDNSLDVDSNY